MMIQVRPNEIPCMREAGHVAAEVLARIVAAVEVGVTTYDLDQVAKKAMKDLGAISSCLNYRYGSLVYPAYTCISVNEEVVHGIPSMKTVLKQGDIVSIDVVTSYKGFVGDNTMTVLLEPVAEPVRQLCKVTQAALYAGIDQARAGNRVGDISHAIEKTVKPHGYGIVRDFVGHGVGKTMHEDPQIPNYGKAGKGQKLVPGMTIAIEPMINLGTHLLTIDPDGWTARTRDRKPAAHYEHTVLITEGDPEILTVPFNKK